MMLRSSPPVHSPSSIPEISAEYSLTPNQLRSLSALSAAAKASAYCPYSRFRVGSTLLTTDADVRYKYISGANIENAAYPVGVCAERVALGKAVTELGAAREWTDGDGERGRLPSAGGGGYKGWKSRGNSIRALALSTDVSPPASPCGMCRQFIREFCPVDMPIFMFDKDGNFVVMRLEELLPLSFGPEALPPPADLLWQRTVDRSVSSDIASRGQRTPLRSESKSPPTRTPLRSESKSPPTRTPLRSESKSPPTRTPLRGESKSPPSRTPLRSGSKSPPTRTPSSRRDASVSPSRNVGFKLPRSDDTTSQGSDPLSVLLDNVAL